MKRQTAHMRQAALIVIEALWSIRAHWAASIAACAIVAGMCGSVVLTQGAVAATRAQIVSALDTEMVRSIIVRADSEAGIDSSVLARVATLANVDQAYGLGAAVDVTNSSFPGGPRVGMRATYGFEPALSESGQALPGSVFVSAIAGRRHRSPD